MKTILSSYPNTQFLNESLKQECIIVFSDQSGFTSAMKDQLNETFHKMVLHHLAACFNLYFNGSEEEIEFCAMPIKTVGDEIILAVTWENQSYSNIKKGIIVSFMLKKIKILMSDLEKSNIPVKIAIHYVKEAFPSQTYSNYLQQLTKGTLSKIKGTPGMSSIPIGDKNIPIPPFQAIVFSEIIFPLEELKLRPLPS